MVLAVNAAIKIANALFFIINSGSITNFVGFPIPLVALSAHIE